MKVLMISGDPGVLDPKSEAGKRTEEYQQILGTLDVLVCRGSIFSFVFGFFRGLRMMLKRYDIITAQDMEHSFLAWIFSRLYKIPWQMQIHTDVFSLDFVRSSVSNRVRVWLAKFLIPKASCVRVVSKRIKDSLISNFQPARPAGGFPISKLTVLPIFVDADKIKNAPIKTDLHEKYGRDKFIILMASRITREKNIRLALEAFVLTKAQILQDLAQRDRREQSNPAAAGYASLAKFGAETLLLLIVGDGPEFSNLKFKVSSLKLHDYIVFEPHTDDLISYYKTCDLFLLTSNYEGYGRTLVEAAAAGAKIISSDVGVASEIFEPDCIFKVGDKEDLKNKLTAAFQYKLPGPKPIFIQTKDEYLKLYKKIFEYCSPCG